VVPDLSETMGGRKRFNRFGPSAKRSVKVCPSVAHASRLPGFSTHLISSSDVLALADAALDSSYDEDESHIMVNSLYKSIPHCGLRRSRDSLSKQTLATSSSNESRDESPKPLVSLRAGADPTQRGSPEEQIALHEIIDATSHQTPPSLALALQTESEHSDETSSEASLIQETEDESLRKNAADKKASDSAFMVFRLNYLLVTMAIMLADGLQGTHLYVLYEGYGFSVASLYCLGFVTGAVTSPITGPLVDRIGRKKAALIYCVLEIGINLLEQYPILAGLIVSRMVGGITTNLLSTVFETWLDTEYRRRGFDNEKYEIIMRDSVIVSNLSAIASGYLAHHLAEKFGPVGPFEGAVTCTVVALAVVAIVWSENYGSSEPGVKSAVEYLSEAVKTFKSDSRLLRVSIIQGLTCGSIQIFIFLWSPALRQFAQNAPKQILGLDSQGEPAYGLIFGAFMATGVIGGIVAPFIRKAFTRILAPMQGTAVDTVVVEDEGEIRPMAVEFLAALCYIVCAGLLLIPFLVPSDGEGSFALSLGAFLIYEFVIGIYMPCEGVIRSIYIPSDARCSLMTMPRIIVNIAVSLGVISTNFVSFPAAFAAVSCLMIVSAALQLSLVSAREWQSLFGRVSKLHRRVSRSFSFTALQKKPPTISRRVKSSPDAEPTIISEGLSAEQKKSQ